MVNKRSIESTEGINMNDFRQFLTQQGLVPQSGISYHANRVRKFLLHTGGGPNATPKEQRRRFVFPFSSIWKRATKNHASDRRTKRFASIATPWAEAVMPSGQVNASGRLPKSHSQPV
jgi:hypothetical protein